MGVVRDPLRFDPLDGELEVSAQFDKAPAEFLARVHTAEYLKLVSDLAKQTTDLDALLPLTPQVSHASHTLRLTKKNAARYFLGLVKETSAAFIDLLGHFA